MKYILIFLFSITAQANVQYLSYDSTGVQFVDSRTEGSKTPYTRICKGIEGESKAPDYKVEILEPGMVFDTRRDWSQGDVLAPGESIVCSIDSGKKTARLDSEQAVRDAEKIKKDIKKANWDAVCASPKAGMETLICQERGY